MTINNHDPLRESDMICAGVKRKKAAEKRMKSQGKFIAMVNRRRLIADSDDEEVPLEHPPPPPSPADEKHKRIKAPSGTSTEDEEEDGMRRNCQARIRQARVKLLQADESSAGEEEPDPSTVMDLNKPQKQKKTKKMPAHMRKFFSRSAKEAETDDEALPDFVSQYGVNID